VSEVELARRALSLLRTDKYISDLSENSTEAKEAKRWYHPTRRQVLSLLDWNFARAEEELNPSSSAPPRDWLYRYDSPPDMLVARRIKNPLGRNADNPEYVFRLKNGRRTLLTDVPEAVLIYTVDLTDTGLFTEIFNNAFVTMYAHNMAYAFSAKENLVQRLFEQARYFIVQAQGVDANEERPAPQRDAPWIEGR
jgi:hypothetical protein